MSETMTALLGALVWASILALPLAVGLLIWSVRILRKGAKERKERSHGKYETQRFPRRL